MCFYDVKIINFILISTYLLEEKFQGKYRALTYTTIEIKYGKKFTTTFKFTFQHYYGENGFIIPSNKANCVSSFP